MREGKERQRQSNHYRREEGMKEDGESRKLTKRDRQEESSVEEN